MDNIKLAVENDRLGRTIVSLVDALALANKTGSRRGHLKTAKKKSGRPPQFTRESIEQTIKEELKALLSEDDFDDYMQSITTTSKAQQRSQGASNKATEEIRAVQHYLLTKCNQPPVQRTMHAHGNERDVDFRFTEDDWPIRTADTDEYANLKASEQAADFYYAVSNLVSNWQVKDVDPLNTFRAHSVLIKCKLVVDKYIGLNPESGLKPREEYEPELYDVATPTMYTEGDNNMKVSRSQLKDMIKEELETVLDEKFTVPAGAQDITVGMGNKPDKNRASAARKKYCDEEVWPEYDKRYDTAQMSTIGISDREDAHNVYYKTLDAIERSFYKCYPDKTPEALEKAGAQKQAADAKAKASAIMANPTGRTTAVKGGRTLEEDLY